MRSEQSAPEDDSARQPALAAGQLDAAAKAFAEAKKLAPDNAEVLKGIIQTEQAQQTALQARKKLDEQKRLEAEAKTAGGLLLPDSAKEKPRLGTILSLGEGKRLESGLRAPFQVKVNDRVGLHPAAFAGRHPRELSGGERQRLALAIVLGDGSARPAAVLLDEPTRGMDRERKAKLAEPLLGLDTAVLVATHDPEFVAAFAQRVVLLADGAVIADGPVHQVLSGGSYFATETARILSGWDGVLTPEEGAAALHQLDTPVAEVMA